MKNKTEYIVQEAAANMPTSCKGSYRRVAVLEIDRSKLNPGDDRPKMISERARGVVRIVRTWEKLNVGKTEKCAYSKAYKEAEELAEKLNKENSQTAASISTFADIHKKLGCKGCVFCNPEALNQAPCCTFPSKLNFDPKSGKCLSRLTKF